MTLISNFTKQIEGIVSLPLPGRPSFSCWASLFPFLCRQELIIRKSFPTPDNDALCLPKALFTLQKESDHVNIYKNKYTQMPSPNSGGHVGQYLQERASRCGTSLHSGGHWSQVCPGSILRPVISQSLSWPFNFQAGARFTECMNNYIYCWRIS